jgi:hypothetical protein
MFSLVALQHAMHAGARAKNLNRRWLKSALEIKDGTAFELIANLYTYSHHCALKQTNEAALHLERCLQLVDVVRPLVRIILISAAASFVAWHWDDAPKATEWRKRLKTENGLPFLSRLGLDVSMCCAERDFAKAVELWNEGINFIERIPDATARLVQEGPWREWGKEIEERRMAADG